MQDAEVTEEAPFTWLPPAAYDVTLKLTLQDPRSPMYWDRIGASYVWPPLGQTLSHVSGTKTVGKNVIMSPDRWSEKWMSPGTRIYHVRHVEGGKKPPKLRWIGGFSAKGVPEWNHVYINLPTDLDELRWRNAPRLPANPYQGSSQPPGGHSAGSVTEADADMLDEGMTLPQAAAAAKRLVGQELQVATLRKQKVMAMIATLPGVEDTHSSAGETSAVTRDTHSKKRALTKTRDRLEKFRMLSNDPISMGAKSLPKAFGGAKRRRYDGRPTTDAEFYRPQRGSDEQLESLAHLRFYYQPEDDMAALAYRISMDQGCHDYTEEEKRARALELNDEFCRDLDDQVQAWNVMDHPPRILYPHESGAPPPG